MHNAHAPEEHSRGNFFRTHIHRYVVDEQVDAIKEEEPQTGVKDGQGFSAGNSMLAAGHIFDIDGKDVVVAGVYKRWLGEDGAEWNYEILVH